MEPPAQATTFHGMSRFSVVRMLGAGGMGVVYEVYDHDREAYVALKTLPTLTPENLRRFKNEFRALQDIKHPNLVALDELMEVDGVWFFTMELIDGVDFVSHVRPGPSPSQLPTMPPPAIDDLSSEPFRQLVAAYRHTGDVEATRTEAKEVVGGFALLQADSREEVLALTKEFLDVVGEGECEVRQLYEVPAHVA